METKTDPRSADTARLMDSFNEVFQLHDPAPLKDMIAEDCVIEKINPAPTGDRCIGRDACRALDRDRDRARHPFRPRRDFRDGRPRDHPMAFLAQRHNLDTRRKSDAGT